MAEHPLRLGVRRIPVEGQRPMRTPYRTFDDDDVFCIDIHIDAEPYSRETTPEGTSYHKSLYGFLDIRTEPADAVWSLDVGAYLQKLMPEKNSVYSHTTYETYDWEVPDGEEHYPKHVYIALNPGMTVGTLAFQSGLPCEIFLRTDVNTEYFKVVADLNAYEKMIEHEAEKRRQHARTQEGLNEFLAFLESFGFDDVE